MAAELKENALAKFEDVQQALAPYKPEAYHRLVPTALMERSPLFRPALAIVKINPEDPRDVYASPAGDGSVCLHTQALERIGNALGMDWIETRYERDPKEPFLVTAHVRGRYVDAVGQRREITASATSDLRDGSITAEVLKGGLRTARQFIAERTEARARNRVVKKVTGMPTSFRKEELQKPFVAVRWRLDETDPEVKRAIIAQGVGAADQVFATTNAPALDAGHDPAEAEAHIEGEFTEQTAAPADPEPVEEEAPAPKPAADPDRAAAIRAHVEEIRKKAPLDANARKKPPTQQQAGLSVSAIANAAGAAKLTVEQKKTLWRAVLEFLFGGFGGWDEVSNERMGASIEWAKASPAEVLELVAFLAHSQPRVADISTAISAGQQELIGGGAA